MASDAADECVEDPVVFVALSEKEFKEHQEQLGLRDRPQKQVQVGRGSDNFLQGVRKYGAALKSLNIYFRSILSVSVPDIRVGEAGGGATESGGEKRTKVKGETSPLDEKRVHG